MPNRQLTSDILLQTATSPTTRFMESDHALIAREDWRGHNRIGIALSNERRWPEAIVAFEQALLMLDDTQAGMGAPESEFTATDRLEAKAQVSSNLAQAHFQAGYLSEALPYAERSCAIRVTLFGEDALSVARARADMAVILGALGEVDHAISLVGRAILAVENRRGEASSHLVPLLENAARLLLSANRAAEAAPYAQRLRMLLQTLNESESSANHLLLTIAAVRVTKIEEHSPVPAHTFDDTPAAAGADDFVLRESIAETGDLLRNTPTNNVAHEERAELHESAALMDSLPDVASLYAQTVDEFPEDQQHHFEGHSRGAGLLDSIDLQETLGIELQNTLPTPAKPEKILDGAAFDLVEPPPPTLNAFPLKFSETRPENPLGFEVQYGIPQHSHTSTVVPEGAEETESEVVMVERPPIALVVEPHEDAQPPRQAMRAVGGPRHGRTQVVEPNRIWYVVAAAVAFIAAIAVMIWVVPMFR